MLLNVTDLQIKDGRLLEWVTWVSALVCGVGIPTVEQPLAKIFTVLKKS